MKPSQHGCLKFLFYMQKCASQLTMGVHFPHPHRSLWPVDTGNPALLLHPPYTVFHSFLFPIVLLFYQRSLAVFVSLDVRFSCIVCLISPLMVH